MIVYNNSSGASRGTTTVSSVAGNVVTVASTPSSTDADDVIMPTISGIHINIVSNKHENSAVYMAASGTALASIFVSGNKVMVQSADISLNRDIQSRVAGSHWERLPICILCDRK